MQALSTISAPEIGNLWTQYLQDSMGICVMKYALKHMKDEEIRSLYEHSLGISEKHIHEITEMFKQFNFPIPIGFTDKDVNDDAPPLFSDAFWLEYLHNMVTHGLSGYHIAFSTSLRKDIRDFYRQCNLDSMDLYDRSLDLLMKKGLYSRPPIIAIPERVEFVYDSNYVNGWLGEKRPLNSIEINNIFFNLRKSILAKALLVGFSQVAVNKEVKQYLLKANYTIQKHISIFSNILHEDDLPSPTMWDAEVTSSTIAPFSDKLIMYHSGFVFNMGIAYYGAAIASSFRRDLVSQCELAVIRDLKNQDNWIEIMIRNGWFEQPPQAIDRKALSKV